MLSFHTEDLAFLTNCSVGKNIAISQSVIGTLENGDLTCLPK